MSAVTTRTTPAAVYGADGAIALRDVPIRPPREGELLVRISACGICSSELMQWYAAAKAPFVLGHEPVGRIEACGPGAAPHAYGGPPFAVGQRVFVHHHAPCTTCRCCRRGDYVQCETWRATRLQPGGMARSALVPEPIVRADVLPLPDTIGDDAAIFVEPLATVVKSLRRASLGPADRVLVIGLGVMGLLHVLLARSLGAQRVIGVDRVAARRHAAARVGADAALDPGAGELRAQVDGLTDGEGADVVIVGPGSPGALDAGAACVARGGALVAFSPLPPEAPWPAPLHDLFFKDVRIIASYSAGPDETREALRLLSAGMPVEGLITHRFALREAALAYQTAANADEALKVIVYPGRS